MISVTLMGGLGNQMFQYAFAKSLSLKEKKDLYLDSSFLKRRDFGSAFVYRNFDLDIFGINECLKIDTSKFTQINEPHFNYSSSLVDYCSHVLKSNQSLSLNGYWQSSKYFKHYEKEIKQEFKFKNKVENNTDTSSILHQIKNSNSVMLNIRRSDFVNNNFHGTLGVDYVNAAKKIIKQKINNPVFFVFSDDVEWCVHNLQNEDTRIINHISNDPKFEHYLQLMVNCNHFIIPNSTFAWWAAYLSESKNKIVIAPNTWFLDKKINTSDIYLENWIRL